MNLSHDPGLICDQPVCYSFSFQMMSPVLSSGNPLLKCCADGGSNVCDFSNMNWFRKHNCNNEQEYKYDGRLSAVRKTRVIFHILRWHLPFKTAKKEEVNPQVVSNHQWIVPNSWNSYCPTMRQLTTIFISSHNLMSCTLEKIATVYLPACRRQLNLQYCSTLPAPRRKTVKESSCDLRLMAVKMHNLN